MPNNRSAEKRASEHTVAVSNRDLRWFCLVASLALLLCIGVHFVKHHRFINWPLYPVALFAIAAAVYPRFILPVYKLWVGLGKILGFINSRIILTLMFFGVITPVAFFFKLRNIDPLDRKFLGKTESYWKPRKAQPQPMGVQF